MGKDYAETLDLGEVVSDGCECCDCQDEECKEEVAKEVEDSCDSCGGDCDGCPLPEFGEVEEEDECDCDFCSGCQSMTEEVETEGGFSQVEFTTFPWEPADVEYELETVRDLFRRKCERYHNECPEEPGQQIRNILVEQDGNFTIVVLDTVFGPMVGVAKFNPVDVKVTRGEDKHGVYFYREQSSFDPAVGFVKAANRAVDKLLNQFVV